MEEIIKHINDTNASYRDIAAGDAKNTDLFLDREHKLFFHGLTDIHVILRKDNLMQAMLFISSVLPRKYDSSSLHYKVPFNTDFVYDNILKLEGLFSGSETFEMNWTIRTDVPKKNGEIDERFYMNGLLHEYTYTNKEGKLTSAKFTIRDYLAGGYSDIHFRKTDSPGVYDVFITNTTDYRIDNDTDTQDVNCDSPLQQIFYGAPGTGKSHAINEQTEGESVIRTTFHPDSDYSTFVGAYKPTMGLLPICDELGQPMKIGSTVLHKEQIVYEFVDQAFLQAYVQAWKFYAENADDTKKQYLIIEEINRGNCAQIFGDLFQLLDRNDKGFSVYPINADKDMKKQLEKAFKGISIVGADKINALYKGKNVVSQVLSGDILLLPDNLYIWATMNTSDQSLFPIDSAFKRRWDWKYMPIDTKKESWSIDIDGNSYSWSSFLEKINKEIFEATSSEDKQLGFYFCKAQNGVVPAEKFVGKVLFYIYNDVFKDYAFDREFFKNGDGLIAFRDYFDSDGSINETIVAKLLDNLGVIKNEVKKKEAE